MFGFKSAWKKSDPSPFAPDGVVVTAEPLERVTLIPYGSGHLRVTDFPEAMGAK